MAQRNPEVAGDGEVVGGVGDGAAAAVLQRAPAQLQGAAVPQGAPAQLQGAAVPQGAPAQLQGAAADPQGYIPAAFFGAALQRGNPRHLALAGIDPTLLQINDWMAHLNPTERMILQRSLYLAAYDYVFERMP